jgi:hypothetical protein
MVFEDCYNLLTKIRNLVDIWLPSSLSFVTHIGRQRGIVENSPLSREESHLL